MLVSKKCFTCGQEKPIDKFAVVKKTLKKTNETKQYRIRDCYSCRSKVSYAQKKIKDSNFLKKKQEYYKEYRRKDKTTSMIYTAKHKAKKYGIPFNITKEDIEIPEYCPLLGIKLKVDSFKVIDESPSLDRVIPKNGYVKGNVWVISNKANRIKNDATIQEIETLLENLKKKYSS